MNSTAKLRLAEEEDVESIVALLADDPLGAQRERFESPLPSEYRRAFSTIDADPNNELVVATCNERVVGVLQLTFIPYLTYQGGWRALIEGVRIARDFRSQGLGKQMFEWAIDRARQRNCHLVQLTADKSRSDAQRFYARLGFEATHEGFKLHLRKPAGDASA